MAIGIILVASTALSLVGIGLAIYIISIYNGLISLKSNIRKSWANIDVLLKQRNDELPNVIECVKEYMKYEREMLDMVLRSRERLVNATTIPQKAAASMEITNALRNIFAISENYPDLKASNNFIQLQNRISSLENEIADRREFYNDSVNAFNIRIQSFPDKYIARMMHYVPQEMFAVSKEEKKNIDVNFETPS